MSASVQGKGWGNPWRIAGWGGAAALLAVPLIAGWPWAGSDFAFAAVMFGTVGGAFELVVRASASIAYRAGAAVALATSFLLVWINGAVGIIGSEDNPLNLIYLGEIAFALVGALLARFRAPGTMRAMAAAALLQAAISIAVLVAGWGAEDPPGAFGLFLLNGGFVAAWSVAALCFRRASREHAG